MQNLNKIFVRWKMSLWTLLKVNRHEKIDNNISGIEKNFKAMKRKVYRLPTHNKKEKKGVLATMLLNLFLVPQ